MRLPARALILEGLVGYTTGPMGIVIQLNGAAREIRSGQTVADLVCELGLLPDQVAVEVNQELVPREERAERRLQAGDAIELVTLVGGG